MFPEEDSEVVAIGEVVDQELDEPDEYGDPLTNFAASDEPAPKATDGVVLEIYLGLKAFTGNCVSTLTSEDAAAEESRCSSLYVAFSPNYLCICSPLC